MNKKISIIVPVYNTEEYLERCIRSIMNQTYTNLEIIIINDGSTDMSLSICNRLQNEDKRIIIINQENKGVGNARNVGLDIATGDYISFVDSDDTIESNFYLELIASAIETDADIVESGAKVILPNNIEIFPYEKETKINLLNSTEYMRNYLKFSLNVSVWGKIYKKTLIGDERFPNLNINEDFIFLWEIVKKTKIFCENLNVNYTYYLDKPISLSRKPFNKDNMTMIKHIDKVLKDVKHQNVALIEEAVNHYNACLLHNLILYYNYISLDNILNLYIEERNEMIKRATHIKTITSYLLLNEADYNICTLINDIIEISNKKQRYVK